MCETCPVSLRPLLRVIITKVVRWWKDSSTDQDEVRSLKWFTHIWKLLLRTPHSGRISDLNARFEAFRRGNRGFRI